MQHTIALHPSLKVGFLLDADCEKALLEMAKLHIAPKAADEFSRAWQRSDVSVRRTIANRAGRQLPNLLHRAGSAHTSPPRAASLSPAAILAWELKEEFTKDTRGPIKGDICRGVALRNTGGYYADVDLVSRMSFLRVERKQRDFITATAAGTPNSDYFQAFIGATEVCLLKTLQRH